MEKLKFLIALVLLLKDTEFQFTSGKLKELYFSKSKDKKGDYISIETYGDDSFDLTIFINGEVQEFLEISFDDVLVNITKILNI